MCCSVLHYICGVVSAEAPYTLYPQKIPTSVAVCCSMLQYVAVCCSVLQCVAVCCIAVRCVTACWSVFVKLCLQNSAIDIAACCRVLQCAAVCCSMLQCVCGVISAKQCYMCCSAFQHVASCCVIFVVLFPQKSAISHRNSLQHTNTYGNPLQLTATRCNTQQHINFPHKRVL